MKKAWVLSYPLSAHRRLWSDWADAQADLRLCWAHMPYCWFCHEAAQILFIRMSIFFLNQIWATSWENLFMQYANNKGADQPEHPCSLISTFVVQCLDSIIPLASISEISSLCLAVVVAQAGFCLAYRKFPKYSDTQNIFCNHSKIWTMWLYHRVMSPNDAEGMANSVDPDQSPPLGAVWSGSALFAQAYLSENLGSIR